MNKMGFILPEIGEGLSAQGNHPFSPSFFKCREQCSSWNLLQMQILRLHPQTY